MHPAAATPSLLLDAAHARLEAALVRLEREAAGRAADHRAREAATALALEDARGRERQLEAVAADASAALTRAAAEVRAALAAEA